MRFTQNRRRLNARFVMRTCSVLCFTGMAGNIAFSGQAWASPPEQSLYSFTGPDGYYPSGAPVLDRHGNLFGVTASGGEANNDGVVYELSPPSTSGQPWTYTQLYAFTGGTDGSGPVDALVLNKSGDLIGVTNKAGASGNGTVFELSPSKSGYTFQVLHAFTGTDGANPTHGVTLDQNGTAYGVTFGGGTAGNGVIYKLTPPAKKGAAWSFVKIHELTSADGTSGPYGLVTIKNGTLYGATHSGYGAIYRLRLSSRAFSVIYAFNGGADGAYPTSVTFDPNNVLVGATSGAGNSNKGTVYQLRQKDNAWIENTVASFDGQSCGEAFTNLYVATDGNYFGTANYPGCIFEVKISASGTSGKIISLDSELKSAAPLGGVAVNAKGDLFGTDSQGGTDLGGEVWEVLNAALH